jgi:HNH endonuclease
MTKSRGIIKHREVWTASQLAVLRREYADRQTAEVARLVGHTLSSTYRTAYRLGLHKSEAYLASPAAGRLDGVQGASHRFTKGHASWNKGTHWKAGGRSPETQFKPGARPHTWRPIGSERVNDDGIRQRKISDTGYPPRDWKSIHVLIWEAANGPVPRGHIVVFKDRNREHLVLENFELVTRQELMRRNSYHTRYPKDIGLVIQLKGALQRQINKRERDAKQD